MQILFIFLDGVGLGNNDPAVNPLAGANLPHLEALLDGSKLVADSHKSSDNHGKWLVHTTQATLLALDACLGVEGAPQSASGQATLLTGKNVAKLLGAHDGPKPNPRVMEILQQATLFSWLRERNLEAKLLNAYPPRYFESINNGHRLPGVIALSARYAGMHINDQNDLARGEAISADFTAQGWREHLGLSDTPVINLRQAGERLSSLTDGSKLSLFEYWLSDVVGHHQDMQAASQLLEQFDEVLGSLVEAWMDRPGVILITSDHGNLEDMSTRHHTRNDVPLVLIGTQSSREEFIDELFQVSPGNGKLSLADITPTIMHLA